MDGKIEIKRDRSDFYILEVNDKGDTIQFDLTDISLAEKILKASEELKVINDEYVKKVLELDKEEISKEEKARKIIEIDRDFSTNARKTFDGFMGEGACQKIFGDANYYGMYIELFDQLEPHFDKMIIKSQKAKQRLVEKYKPKKSDVM